MENAQVYPVRRPADLASLLSISLIAGIQILSIRMNHVTYNEKPLLFTFRWGWVVFCLIIVGILLYRLFTLRSLN
ncbi:hypothetical protein GCM10010912_49300 [Paenibacillus albidus]|uniref:Uncharacterized protein n=1 Tax=Paenibacillus albidus TaxID=2041023 RepID=A0A917CUI1_9BACL|nr:hypothetical protein GCM10010912_49300 [Paenibacillus albidus]